MTGPDICQWVIAGFGEGVACSEFHTKKTDRTCPNFLSCLPVNAEFFGVNAGPAKGSFQAGRLCMGEDIVSLISSGATRYASDAHYKAFDNEFRWLFKTFCSQPDLPISLVKE